MLLPLGAGGARMRGGKNVRVGSISNREKQRVTTFANLRQRVRKRKER